MSWNIRGWTVNNNIIRKTLIYHLNSDILCVQETHLKDGDTINIYKYKFYRHNRLITHTNAPKTFGGIGIFVKFDFLDSYSVNTIDQCVEGIQIIQFKDKVSGFTFIVGNCYLAPYNSIYGNISTESFAHLITQLYLNSEVDSI